MNKNLSLFIYCLLLTGCELIVIGSKTQQPKIEVNQKSPVGAIYLFKTELDSSNIPAATNMLIQPKGGFYTALEKYEMWDEVFRLKRLISTMPVTKTTSDSLSNYSYIVNIEFDYYRTISFQTRKIDERWFITGYSESRYYNWAQ
jgi:hypothetical protein